MKEARVAVVGATGLVGREMLKVLEQRNFPLSNLDLLASERSRGKKLEFAGEELPVKVLGENSFSNIDIALFSAGASISREFAPIAAKAGAVVVDNSSAFRMESEVPLVVPEVNPGDISWHKGIIANPNCSTIQLVVVLYPLHQHFALERVVVTTFQAVSGTGRAAVEELKRQTREVNEGKTPTVEVYPHQIAFNVLPHIDTFLDNGYTREEMKMVNEAKKIIGLPELAITATTVRVPVFVGHSESVNAQFKKPVEPDDAQEVLSGAPGVEVLDDPFSNIYPMPIDCASKDYTYVGRIRKDFSTQNALNLWIVSDNLRKGGALNAVQIAELLVD
ncbi:MAG: aspartate-semialdehyde dehydrogenase [Actinomycetota bacterium]|nr:aspartate-semialdehyde dehydrogenase [Actinomycetota bacterium]